MYMREYYRVCLIIGFTCLISRYPLVCRGSSTSISLGTLHIYVRFRNLIGLYRTLGYLTHRDHRVPIRELTKNGYDIFHGLNTCCQICHGTLTIACLTLDCLKSDVGSIIQEVLQSIHIYRGIGYSLGSVCRYCREEQHFVEHAVVRRNIGNIIPATILNDACTECWFRGYIQLQVKRTIEINSRIIQYRRTSLSSTYGHVHRETVLSPIRVGNSNGNNRRTVWYRYRGNCPRRSQCYRHRLCPTISSPSSSYS